MAGMEEATRNGLKSLRLPPLEDVRCSILSLQTQLEAMRALMMDPNRVHAIRNSKSPRGAAAESWHLDEASSTLGKEASRIRLNLKLDIGGDRHAVSDSPDPHPSTFPSAKDLIFIIMARPSDRVRDIKERFLERLTENKLLPMGNLISEDNTLLFMDEKVLFDTDLLGHDLEMNLLPANEYNLTLRCRM
ncbi:unnamed protein product [Phytomonas sp. Hart1]|nr:unnamed protein product [Phytomonas sp. Hart1]|eukprot:CCW66589.1 unnamed protein product [Phytomonas sp. isolate Hart1]